MDTQGKGHELHSCSTNSVVEDAHASTNETQTQPAKKKPRGRPFEPGQSGNPNGRPRGSLNKNTLRLQQVAEEGGEELVEVIKQQALAGDRGSQRLLLPRILPRAKNPTVPFALPDKMDTPEALQEVNVEILRQLAWGNMPPEQAEALVFLVEKLKNNLVKVNKPNAVQGVEITPYKPSMREALTKVVEKTGFPSDALKLTDEQAIATSRKLKETAS